MHATLSPAQTLALSSAEEGPMPRARVLLVDDDERNLLAVSTVLEDVADVVVANSGEEALRQLLKGEFAVILLDVYMPSMDGYETAQIIRSREQTKRVPIVFLSAVNKEDQHLIRGYSMGAVDYVFKPVDPTILRSKVAVFVDLFSMTKEIQRKARQEQALLDANLRANAERLRVEQELRRAQQRQEAIIESLPIILYLEDVHASPRVPKFVSGNFAAVTGYAFQEIARDPSIWIDRLHPEDRARVIDAMAGRPFGRSLSVEYRWQCADGQYKHFLDQAVLLRNAEGSPVEYAGTLLDVTERKELESQLIQARKMDAIGQLTGGIAHDFNNLLAAVLGGLGMIERRITLTEDQQKIVGMTRHAAEQGAGLVKHLLAFARRQKLAPAVIGIDNLSASVTDLLAHTLGGLVELKWSLEPGVSPVFADSAQLELALMNLVINARDAMPEGGTITVSARNATIDIAPQVGGDLASGRYVVLSVRDTGCGIEQHLLDQVLEPFFTTKAVGKGTGLGLSMVYGFAQQSGGAVRVDSEVGKGTCVEIWLPDGAAQQADLVPLLVETVGVAPLLNILLVDDHDAVRTTTAALLEDLGHRVTHTADAVSAVELARQDPQAFDVLITDYAMPRTSGTELVRQIRNVCPEIPALIVTGYADVDSLNACDAVGILEKPFSPEQLQAALFGTVPVLRQEQVA
ncbi:response regulator [Sphingomonas xinjiangensis]|uniref:histidine kinase n=1 Tax=Sphingomonas xinjiangensis TaxID=643568 RepID=A0A840YMU6_9SPHN|nr:response regulator [Sphingomonas xinjiangensis]MBB5711050.1 PAS domain S-box-containing protein [Sphingomonas xinjiangensis]